MVFAGNCIAELTVYFFAFILDFIFTSIIEIETFENPFFCVVKIFVFTENAIFPHIAEDSLDLQIFTQDINYIIIYYII